MLVKIPRDRLGVVIGSEGQTKKRIERKSRTEIDIQGNSAEITGNAQDVIRASEVVKAIARGFHPEKALLLLKEDYMLDIISLKGKTKKTQKRLLGRVIGKGGRTRKRIQDLTHTCVAVYGKTVAIIGKKGDVDRARESVERLLKGRTHGAVYRYMERTGKKK